MKRFPLSLLLFVLLCSSAISGELTLYTREDYISPQVIKAFREKTGIRVRQVYFDSDRTRDEIITTSQGKDFDLVIIDSITTRKYGKKNLLATVSKSQVPNMKYIDSQWEESCGNFGIPYFIGTMGIVYDKTKFTVPPTSWGDLLFPEQKHQGRVVMIDDTVDTLVPPLLYLGHNINTEKNSELKAAYELLVRQAPHVLSYKYAAGKSNIPDQAEKMDMAPAFSGDRYTLNEKTGTENWEYVVPEEGTVLRVDCMTIAQASKNKQEALAFLNFINDPPVAAINTEGIYSGTPISKIRTHLPEEMKDDPEIFPLLDMDKKTQMYRIISDDSLHQRKRFLDTLLNRDGTQ